jgi:Tfp pilus assembly protein PilN
MSRRLNLSTRPFYNERAVHAVLVALGAAVLAITAFNLWQVYGLSGRQAEFQGRIALAESKTREFRDKAANIRASINPRDLEQTIAAAREANGLIDRRVFSWTELFNHLELTLPPQVRISAIRPRVEKDGSVTLGITVLARTVDGVNTFIENLEKDGVSSGVLSREEFVNQDGLIQASLEGRYAPVKAGAAAAAPGSAR